MFFDGDNDIVLVTVADVGKVGHPVARLVSHGPLQRPRGGRGGQGGDAAGGPGGGAGPSGEGSNSAATEAATERARARWHVLMRQRLAMLS